MDCIICQFFLLSVYFYSPCYIEICADKVIHIILHTLVHSLFCALNFMLPACTPNFAKLCTPHIRLSWLPCVKLFLWHSGRCLSVLHGKVICRAVINGGSDLVGKWHVNVCSALYVWVWWFRCSCCLRCTDLVMNISKSIQRNIN